MQIRRYDGSMGAWHRWAVVIVAICAACRRDPPTTPHPVRDTMTVDPAVQANLDALKSSNGREVLDAFARLAAAGPSSAAAVPVLIAMLDHPTKAFVIPDFHPRGHHLPPSETFLYAERAVGVLQAIGEPAVPALLDVLARRPPSAALPAATALGGIAKDKRLGTSAARVGRAVADYLARDGAGLSVDQLKAIGHANPDAAAIPLLELVHGRVKADEPRNPRAFAALALGEIGARSAVAELGRIGTTDTEGLVRAFALASLAKLDNSEATHRILRDALKQDTDSMVRGYASKGLFEARTPAGIEAIIVALADSYPEVRLNGAHALWAVKADAAVAPLMQALTVETEYLTRDYQLHALAYQQAKQAIPLIRQVLADPAKSQSHSTAQHSLDVLEGRKPPVDGFAR
jgi:HEAT repeat protein